MVFRRPAPHLEGVKVGIAMIAIGAFAFLFAGLFYLFSGVDHWYPITLGIPAILFMMGWIVFLNSLSKHVNPYGNCPICGYKLAWDNVYKLYFCHHCKKRWEAHQSDMGFEIDQLP
jgi:DNA-directed RNA polymerase subunit RPC12/RpoP